MFLNLSELSTPVRYSLFLLANVLLFLWARYIIAPARFGWMRIGRLPPIIVLCCFICYLFRFGRELEQVLSVHINGTYLWLTIWKALGLCLNRGQLTKAYHSQNALAFAVALLLPVNVAYEEHPVSVEKKNDDKTETMNGNGIVDPYKDVRFSVIKLKGYPLLKELLTYLFKVGVQLALCIALAPICLRTKAGSLLQSWVLSWLTLFFVCIFQDFNGMICVAVFGIKLKVNFDQPYFSTSVSDLWSRRWNLVMSAQLREIIYDPIIEGRLLANERYHHETQNSLVRRVIGIFSAFLASGAIHSVIFMEVGHTTEYPLLCTLFFVANGLFVIMEKLGKCVLERLKIHGTVISYIPTVVSIAYVHCVLLLMVHFLLSPDVARTGITQNNLEGIVALTPPFLRP